MERANNQTNLLPFLSNLNLPEAVKPKRKRRKTEYKKIDNEVRKKLIDLVLLKNYYLRDAADMLGINFSTAKTILRIFRIERRIRKKNDKKKALTPKTIFRVLKERSIQHKKIQKNMRISNEIQLEINNSMESERNQKLRKIICEIYLKNYYQIISKINSCYYELNVNQDFINETNLILQKMEECVKSSYSFSKHNPTSSSIINSCETNNCLHVEPDYSSFFDETMFMNSIK